MLKDTERCPGDPEEVAGTEDHPRVAVSDPSPARLVGSETPGALATPLTVMNVWESTDRGYRRNFLAPRAVDEGAEVGWAKRRGVG
jgi:hypothetical protein